MLHLFKVSPNDPVFLPPHPNPKTPLDTLKNNAKVCLDIRTLATATIHFVSTREPARNDQVLNQTAQVFVRDFRRVIMACEKDRTVEKVQAYMSAATQLLSNSFKQHILTPLSRGICLEAVVKKVTDQIISNEGDVFAEQDLGQITPESILEEIVRLKIFFPDRDDQFLIVPLYTAIRNKHGAEAMLEVSGDPLARIHSVVQQEKESIQIEIFHYTACLAQLCTQEEAACHPLFDMQFAGRFKCEGLLESARRDWDGYETEGRISGPNKVMILINGIETEVHGGVRYVTDSDCVHVWGKRQIAIEKRNHFFQTCGRLGIPISRNVFSSDDFSDLKSHPNATGEEFIRAYEEVQDAIVLRENAWQYFCSLQRERRTAETHLEEISLQNNAARIECVAEEKVKNRMAFLELFIPSLDPSISMEVRLVTLNQMLKKAGLATKFAEFSLSQMALTSSSEEETKAAPDNSKGKEPA